MQTLFGTDGIRTRIGQSPLTPQELLTFGAAVGAWITRTQKEPKVLIAHDTRHSAALVKASLKAGLLLYPVSLFDAGILPTPALFHQVTQGAYDYGIMITASHNPYQDNGIKIITKKSGKLTAIDEETLNALYAHNPHTPSYEQLGTDQAASEALSNYLAALTSFFPPNFLDGITLVIDCAQGAYASIVPAFLKKCGAQVISLSTTPDGKNINKNCGSLHPQALQQRVITEKADAGFAFDGDGDRLVAVARDGSCKDGDELLSFLLNHPIYKNESALVGTILTNQGLSAHLEKQGKIIHRTPVGDKHVVEKMKHCEALMGGEPSGHLILRDFTDTSDGLFTLLRIVQTALLTHNWQFTSFTKLPQVLLNIPVACRKDLNKAPYATFIRAQEAELSEGRVVVRYSGTEPLLRIMVEATTSEKAYSIGNLLAQQLTEALTKE